MPLGHRSPRRNDSGPRRRRATTARFPPGRPRDHRTTHEPHGKIGVMVALETLADDVARELTVSFPNCTVQGVWLYGSHARDEARRDSDVDLGVLCDRPLDPVSLFDASGRLSARLGVAVDLVDLRRANCLLRVEATHRGRPLVSPTFEADLFTTHALADHAAFTARRNAATKAFEEKIRGR